jgi:hypothetical protein
MLRPTLPPDNEPAVLLFLMSGYAAHALGDEVCARGVSSDPAIAWMKGQKIGAREFNRN